MLLLVIGLALPRGVEARPANTGIDVVALATVPGGGVLLATPTDRPEWRVREIRLPIEPSKTTDVALAPTGTKLAFVSNARSFVVDLTTRVPALSRCVQSHTLPDARFAFVRDRAARLVSDEPLDSCSHADPDEQRADVSGTRAVPAQETLVSLQRTPQGVRVTRAGEIVYWTPDHQLYLSRDGEEIPIRGQVNADIVDVIPSASKGSLVLAVITGVEGRASAAYGVRREGGEQLAIDETPMGLPPGVVDVRLAAALQLSGTDPSRALRFVVPEKYSSGSLQWTFWPVAVEPTLYAPVLQFDESEHIRPHLTTIWQDGAFKKNTSLLEWYSQLQPETRRSFVYYRVNSHPGSWLIEYWTYYPIDNGHVGGHPHDTEHVFIEVDKLGGGPRAILAAAHVDASPNNLYSSLDPDDADWPTLPLFVFVELGKHALSPDVNRDGFFTFGRDVNGYRELAHVWGVRDYIGRTDDHWNPYRGSMTVPRRPQYRMRARQFLRYFPGLSRGIDVPDCNEDSPTCAYSLRELPPRPQPRGPVKRELDQAIERAQSTDDAAFYAKVGERKLLFHSDALVPERIYKVMVFPDASIRLGVGHDFFEPAPQVSVGLAVSLMRPFGLRLPFPVAGRLAAEFLASRPRGTRDILVKVVQPTGVVEERFVTRRFGASKELGLRYERMTSNMFGFYFGVHRQFQSETTRPDSRLEREQPLRANWYRLGPMFEFRQWGVQVGPAWNWDNVRFEMRGIFVLKAWKGRSRFGISG